MSVDGDFFWMHPFIYMRGMWEELTGVNREYWHRSKNDAYTLGKLKTREIRGWKVKQYNVDIVVDECRHIMRVSCAEVGLEDEEVDLVISEFNRRIQDEYKYLLRGPR